MKNEELIFNDYGLVEEWEENEFSGLESIEEIVDLMVEKTKTRLENDEEFNKESPGIYYAEMRLDYLSQSSEENFYYVQMAYPDELYEHVKDIQRQANEFYRQEKPAMMKAWGVKDRNSPYYYPMMSALREMLIKIIVES